MQDRSETERLRGTPVDADADATDAGARGAAADGADEIGGTGRTDEADGADAAADAADADPAAFMDMLSWWELSAVHRVTAIADRLDLPLRAYLVLAELARRPPGLSNAQITGIVGLPSATVTTIIGALTADGLVVRHPDRVDRRQVVSDVTELGRARLAAGRPDPGELRELVFDFRPEHLDAVRVFVTRSTSRAYRRSRAQWERRLR